MDRDFMDYVKAIGYMTLHTLGMQAFCIGLFVSFGIWSMRFLQGNFLMILLSLFGAIAVFFAFLNVSVFTGKYGAPLIPSIDITAIERVSILRLIPFEDGWRIDDISNEGVVFIVSILQAIFLSLFGWLKFCVELVTMLIFGSRVDEWVDAWDDFTCSIDLEGFRVLLISLGVILLVFLLQWPLQASHNKAYAPENFQVELLDKTDATEYNRAYSNLTVRLTNNSTKKIRWVEGHISILREDGVSLYEGSISIEGDLESGESRVCTVRMNTGEVQGLELEEMIVYFRVIKTKFEGDRIEEYPMNRKNIRLTEKDVTPVDAIYQ